MPLSKIIIQKLIDKNISVSVAESCTGGKISKIFTDIPGVSKIFNMGLVTYSNQSKNSILKISNSIINKKGAVSEEVINLMIKNLFKISKSDLCIGTTGIAGPSGGSKNKPVGLVYIGIILYKKKYIFKKKFQGNRNKIQNDTISFCLNEIYKLI